MTGVADRDRADDDPGSAPRGDRDPSDEGRPADDDTATTRVVLVRHGESGWNTEHRIQGHSGPGLTARGHAQARAVAGWLAATIGPVPVVSSDLARARETAEHVVAATGVALAFDPDLRERSWGSWEGRTVADLDAEGSSAWSRRAGGEDVADEVGGESGPVLAARVVPALHRHAADRDAVVLITHGGSIWHALHHLLDLPDMTLGGVANTGVAEVLLGADGHAWLQGYNLVSHLGPDGTPFADPGTRQRHHA